LSTTIGFPSHGETSLSYEKENVRINLTVHLFFNLSTKEVVDEALAILSRTSMMDISNVKKCYVHFRNVLIQVHTLSEGVDVRPVIKAFHSKMKTSIVDVSKVRPSITSCKVLNE
jgi:hypothetical protein